MEGWRVTPSDQEALGEVMEMPSTYGCPLVMTNAMEAMASKEIDGLPSEKMVIFRNYLE